jgi:hypothetical protein
LNEFRILAYEINQTISLALKNTANIYIFSGKKVSKEESKVNVNNQNKAEGNEVNKGGVINN